MSIFIILLALPFISCNDDEFCIECSQNNQISSFENRYFRFSRSAVDTSLFYLDSISGESYRYLLCLAPNYQDLEAPKIIKASGSIYSSCLPSSKEYTLISNFELIDVCPQPVPNIAGEFTLVNIWYLNHLVYKGLKVYPPCESQISNIGISENNPGKEFNHGISGNAANNGFSGSFKISNDTIFLSESFVVTLAVGTKSERDFEKKYFEGIFPTLKLTFNISNNRLQLNNFDKNIVYNFYTQ